MRNLSWTVCAVILLSISHNPAHSQQVQSRSGTTRPLISGADSAEVARLQLADTYANAAQYDRAIPLLEDLWANSPGTTAYYVKLKEAYEAAKRYDDAIVLVSKKERSSRVDHLALRSEKARLTYLKGDESAAFALWENALKRSAKDDHSYRIVYNSLLRVRLLGRAVAVLEHGRTEIGSPTLFQTELAYLYGLTGDHDKAMGEYFGLLSSNARQLNYVRNRLSRALEQEGALEASIAVARQRVAANPQNRSYRELLGWLHTEAGAWPDALTEIRAVDRLDGEFGHALFDFAKRAAETGAYDVAMEAYDEVLVRYPDTPVAEEARFGLAHMHELWAITTRERTFDAAGNRQAAPHYDAALEAYRTFVQQFPEHARTADVMYSIGRLQRDVYFNVEQAAETLSDVRKLFPGTKAADRAQLDLGRISITRGNLEEARLVFARLAHSTAYDTIAEEALWEEALIHWYRGEFDIVRALVGVLQKNTSEDSANDAIALRLLLIENAGPDSLDTPLRKLAGADLLLRQRRAEDAVSRLDGLLREYGGHAIADDARFLRARALRETGQTEDAILAFGELPLIHPQSPLCDRSLFEVAEISEMLLGDPNRALKAYTDLIMRYPGSPLVPSARDRIRDLRKDGV